MAKEEKSLIQKIAQISTDCSQIQSQNISQSKKSAEPDTPILAHSYVKDGVLIKFDKNDLDKNGKITIPHNIIAIDSYAFYLCKKVKEIVVPDSVKNIGLGAFGSCINLQKIVLPDNLEHLGTRAFANCISLDSVKLPQNLIEIPYQCFLNCKNLQTINLPENIRIICEQAFADCVSLQKINFSQNMSLQYIGFDVFLNSPIGKKFLREISANSYKKRENKKV